MNFKFTHKPIQTKYDLLSLVLKKTYTEYCRGHYHDDRRIFINVYRQLIRFLLVSDKIYDQSTMLDVAINEKFESEYNSLLNIKNRFDNMKLDKVKAEALFVSTAKQFEEYDDIKDKIRSLHSYGELTDNEYDYILENWDEFLIKHNL